MPDVLITGARVIDGTGNPWIYADVVIEGERIAAIAPPGTVDRDTAGTVIDAEGMICCPGLIDIQSHSIVPFLTDRRSVSKVTQGVTTEILGEGWTPAPFGGKLDGPFSISLVHRLEEDFEYWDTLGRTWTRWTPPFH